MGVRPIPNTEDTPAETLQQRLVGNRTIRGHFAAVPTGIYNIVPGSGGLHRGTRFTMSALAYAWRGRHFVSGFPTGTAGS